MAIHIRQDGNGRHGNGTVSRQPGRTVPAATLLLALCAGVAACGIHTGTFELSPRRMANHDVSPLRVGVVVDKQFMPYKIKFKYWSTPPLTWSLAGLPDAFVKTLNPHFASVAPVDDPGSIRTGAHQLIARMSVDRLHFDGANTTVGNDTVDLTMTFTMQQPDGTEVFRRTFSAKASSPYSQPCALCAPDPRAAFTEAFNAVFAQLSETLAASPIRLRQQP